MDILNGYEGSYAFTKDPVTSEQVNAHIGSVLLEGNQQAQHAEEQAREDKLAQEGLSQARQMLASHGRIPENVDFYFCSEPETVGVSRDQLAEMEMKGYDNSGYGHRAEGKQLFEHALRGYNNQQSLRFVIVGERGEDHTLKPLAFFDYFKADRHISEDYAQAALAFQYEHNIQGQPDIYIISKLVADPARAKTTLDLHRYAIAAVLSALSNTSPAGVLMETQAQPATRRMVGHSAHRYIPGLQVVLDKDMDEYNDPGGKPSKMILYIPHN